MCDIEVRVVQARGLAPKTNNTASPYGVVVVGNQKKKTKTVVNSLDPVFNEPFTIDIGDASHFSIIIQDKSSPGNKDFMGQVIIPVNGLKLDGTNNWFPLKERPKGKKLGVKGEVLLQFAVPAPIAKISSSSQQKEMNSHLQKSMSSQNKVVDLEGLQLDGLPKKLYDDFVNYTNFNLSFNKIIDWPDFTPFVKLQVLNLSGNKLTTIGTNVSLLTNLRELYLNGNNLKAVPPEIGECTKLEKLSIANNQLRKIADEIGYLVKIEELNLMGNPLSAIPPTLGECISIEVLDLSCCELAELPEQFTYMTRLLELNLGSNRLTSLPETLGRMSRLVILNLSDNLLEDLPLSSGLCIGLCKLGAGINIDRNPIKSSDLIKKWKIGTDHLQDFLEKRYDAKGRPPLKDVPRAQLKSKGPVVEKNKSSNSSSFLQSKQSSQSPSNSQSPKSSGSGSQLFQQSTSPSSQPVAPPPQPDPLAEKLRLLADWGKTTIKNEVIPKFNDFSSKIDKTIALDDVLYYGQFTNEMKPEIAKMKALVQGCGVIPPVFSPKSPSGTDKIDLIKNTIQNACQEIVSLLECVCQALDYATQQQLVSLIQIIKGLNARF